LDARTIERDAAAIGRDCPCDDAEQRALPCPVWTDDRKNRALRYAKADVVHGKQAAEALADTLHVEQVAHGYDFTRPSLTASHGHTPPGSMITTMSRQTP